MVQDLIYQSLEQVAEKSGDITPEIYRRYFESCPDSEALMSHLDEIPRGKMMDEVYRLLLEPEYRLEDDYLNWEVKNHALAYSVESYMYRNLFDAVIDTMKESLGADWSEEIEQAWRERTSLLENEITSRFDVTKKTA